MTVRRYTSPLAEDLAGFVAFKRSLGLRYSRSEFTVREFDRHLASKPLLAAHLDRAMLSWLASKPDRKPVSISMDAAVLREFCKYLRRRYPRRKICEPIWPRLPTTSSFAPYVLSVEEIKRLLELAATLDRPVFRAVLYRMLLLVYYCTGIRFSEALRLRLEDLDIDNGVMFVQESKGRSRWVPFHRSLARELDRYLIERHAFARAAGRDRVFVGVNRRTLPSSTAYATIVKLFRTAGLKPPAGRVGPRPYDLRHTFAVHRLTRWYYQGVDIHGRLPWLSAYMGHDDVFGTETYLHATPELLELAANRLRRRFRTKREAAEDDALTR